VALGFIKSLVDYIKPESQPSVKEEIKIEEVSQAENKESNFSYTPEELEEAKEWDVTLEDGLENELSVEENKEERDEDHELDLVLNEMVEDLEVPLENSTNESSVVSGYYGDVLIDGNGVQTQESQVLPVNSNKKGNYIDNSGKVSISPTRL